MQITVFVNISGNPVTFAPAKTFPLLCGAPAEAPHWKWWPGHLHFTESREGQSWNHQGSRAVIPGAVVRLQQQAAVSAVQLPQGVYGAIKATSAGMGTVQLALG